MSKALIVAIFLSQAPIQDLQVFHNTQLMEVINYERDFIVPSRRVNTIHIYTNPHRKVVVPKDAWNTRKAPIPYVGPWANSLRQTAQQFIAIISILQEEGIYYDWEQSTR